MLSVVVPVYNVEETLDRCVRSILAQGVDDIEVILVDDGSSDSSPQRCDSWAGKDSRVKVIHKKNGGLSDARNAGIENSHGEYITFVDSDDFLSDGTYSGVMHDMQDNADCDIVEFPVCRICKGGKRIFVRFPEKLYDDIEDYWLSTKAYLHTYAWNKIYRKRLFDDVRFPVGKIFEDVCTYPLLLKKASKVFVSEKGRYNYCYNEKGITANDDGRGLEILVGEHWKTYTALSAHADRKKHYYMHILDMQIAVCRLTGKAPVIEGIATGISGLSLRHTIKALLLNVFGIRFVCRIFA